MATNQEIRDYLEKVRKAISSDNDVKKLVESIENGIKTTQNNYGKYMQILNQHVDDKAFCYGVALGLVDLGANKNGVNSALKYLMGADLSL